MERLSKKTVRMFDTVILIKRNQLRNWFLHLRKGDLLAKSSPEPCSKCGWRLRRTDCATIEDGITHCICYNCSHEWVE